MKIALYYPWIDLKSGVEKTIYQITSESRDKYTIFTNRLDLTNTFPEMSKLNIIKLRSVPKRKGIFSTLKTTFIIASEKINLNGYDLLQVHSSGISDLILLRNNNIPSVCFCHTPLRSVFDDIYKKQSPTQSDPLSKILFKIFSIFFKLVARYFFNKYKLIIFNSKESYKRAILGRIIDRTLKYEILNPGTVTQKRRSFVNKKYFLLPGRISWSKNIELAILSFNLLYKYYPNSNFKLIIAGQLENKSDVYYKMCKQLSKSKNMIFRLNPSEKEMEELYKNCYAVLATALNEDWGITPIEANSFGKPTICVNSGGFKESQKSNITGYLVNPDPHEFLKAMLKMINDKELVNSMGESAYKNSLKYDWRKFVYKLDSLISKYAKN